MQCESHPNRSWFPAVAGPGDVTKAYFSRSIETFKHHWNGETAARIRNWREVGRANDEIASRTKQDDWGQRIPDVKGGSQTTYVWIEIDVPNDENLAREQLDLDLAASVTYPEPVHLEAFINRQASFDEVQQIRLSASHSGGIYNSLWWLGQIAVFPGIGIGGLCLWWQDDKMRKHGKAEFIPDKPLNAEILA